MFLDVEVELEDDDGEHLAVEQDKDEDDDEDDEDRHGDGENHQEMLVPLLTFCQDKVLVKFEGNCLLRLWIRFILRWRVFNHATVYQEAKARRRKR